MSLEKGKHLEKGKFYKTRFGDVVKVHHVAGGQAQCVYKSVVKGHESLLGSVDLWDNNGEWVTLPKSMHDLESEVGAEEAK